MLLNFSFNLYKKIILKIKLNRASLGIGCDIHYTIRTSFSERISIGDYVYIGPNCDINGLGRVAISRGAILGPNIHIHSANHNFNSDIAIPYDNFFIFKPVYIGENTWIGANTLILPGAKIGEGAIIGGGSVVVGDVPRLAIAAGNPCKVIRYRDPKLYDELKKKDSIYMKLKSEGVLVPDYDEK